jgi:hypothetical protein
VIPFLELMEMIGWLAHSETYVNHWQDVSRKPQVDLAQRAGKTCELFVGFPHCLLLMQSLVGLEHQSHGEALTGLQTDDKSWQQVEETDDCLPVQFETINGQ